MNSFYSESELRNIGFKSLGTDVHVSKKASIYGAENISIGNNVRIDDFCILSGKIIIGNYVHVAAFCGIFGGDMEVEVCDFAGISSRCSIYSQTDDYSGGFLTNPIIPEKYKNTIKGKVVIGRHSIIGTASSVLPGVIVKEGTSIGAMSLVNKDTEEWSVYAGIPARKIKERQRTILNLEKDFLIEKQNMKKIDE